MVGMAATAWGEAAELACLKVPQAGEYTPPSVRRAIYDDLNHPNNMMHGSPPTKHMTTVEQLEEAYNGFGILVACNLCKGPGCHKLYYSHSKPGPTHATTKGTYHYNNSTTNGPAIHNPNEGRIMPLSQD